MVQKTGIFTQVNKLGSMFPTMAKKLKVKKQVTAIK